MIAGHSGGLDVLLVGQALTVFFKKPVNQIDDRLDLIRLALVKQYIADC